MSSPPSFAVRFPRGVGGALACVGLLCACTRGLVAAPVTVTPPVADRAPVSLPIHAISQRPLNKFPTHFDPSGRLLANCSGPSCDVWERGNDSYRGTVASSRCAGWLEPVPKPAAQNPDATLAVVREGTAIMLRRRPTGAAIALLTGTAAGGCDVGATAWAADGSALAFRCDGSLVVFDAHTGAVVDRTALRAAKSFDYVWRDRLVVWLQNESDEYSGSAELLVWRGPGNSAWLTVRGQYRVESVLLDPVTGGAWVASSVAGGECDVDAIDGPDGEQSSEESKGICSSSSQQRVAVTNPIGDAFVLETRTEYVRGTVSVGIHVVRLRPQYGEWPAWGETYPADGEGPTERPYHVALSRDGTWVVVVADPAPRSPRVVLVAHEGSSRRLEFDVTALEGILRGAPIDDVELTDDEQTALLRSKGVTVSFPLDGKKQPRRLTPSEADDVHRREVPSDAAFSTADGRLFTRVADDVHLRRDGCWFPEGWDDEPIETLRVLAGEDAVSGRLLDRKEVEAHFCDPARFAAFVQGKPMPPRPDALWSGR